MLPEGPGVGSALSTSIVTTSLSLDLPDFECVLTFFIFCFGLFVQAVQATLSVYFPPPPSLFDSILSELKSNRIGQ